MAIDSPQGLPLIHTPGYHGPDRRVSERRAGVDRRQEVRRGYGWWDNPDRRGAAARRRQP